jgi:hypothetical protein
MERGTMRKHLKIGVVCLGVAMLLLSGPLRAAQKKTTQPAPILAPIPAPILAAKRCSSPMAAETKLPMRQLRIPAAPRARTTNFMRP